jgi:hypothetical protein
MNLLIKLYIYTVSEAANKMTEYDKLIERKRYDARAY